MQRGQPGVRLQYELNRHFRRAYRRVEEKRRNLGGDGLGPRNRGALAGKRSCHHARQPRCPLNQGELRVWLGRATAGPLVRLCRITPAVVAEASNLPADFHCDPADRIIAATVRLERARLLTQDRKAPGQGSPMAGLAVNERTRG